MLERLPVQYHLEVYVGSFSSDPIAHFEASTPFQPFVVGDYINGRSFANAADLARRLRIVEVEHILWTIENSHIGQKMMVFVEEVQSA